MTSQRAEEATDKLCEYFGWDKGSEQALEIAAALLKFAEEARTDEQEKISRTLDFCKGAIEDAIYSEDGLDGSTGQGIIEMIGLAQKGLAEGCQHCSFQRNAALEEAAGVSEAQKHFDDAGMIRALKSKAEAK